MAIPGSFLSDYAYEASTRTSIFLPPRTSSPTPRRLPRATHFLARTVSSESRKRPRSETSHFRSSECLRDDSPFEAPSPAPFANTRYRLADGIDSPDPLDQDYDYEQDCRPNRFASNAPRTPRSTQTSGWSQTAWNVAGKVLTFCWNTAFRGFHAGGGPGCDLVIPSPTNGGQLEEKHDVFSKNYEAPRTKVPGYFDQETTTEPLIYTRENLPTPTQTPACTSRDSWVLVATPDDGPRRRSRPSLAQQRRKSSYTARTPARPSSAASFASPRGPSIEPRPNSSSGTNEHRNKRVRPSIASPRRSVLEESHTPVSPEVVHFEKKLRRKEHVQNENLRKLNQQLRDMIRQGEQALASRIEVESGTDWHDEGYIEGSDQGQYH